MTVTLRPGTDYAVTASQDSSAPGSTLRLRVLNEVSVEEEVLVKLDTEFEYENIACGRCTIGGKQFKALVSLENRKPVKLFFFSP